MKERKTQTSTAFDAPNQTAAVSLPSKHNGNARTKDTFPSLLDADDAVVIATRKPKQIFHMNRKSKTQDKHVCCPNDVPAALEDHDEEYSGRRKSPCKPFRLISGPSDAHDTMQSRLFEDDFYAPPLATGGPNGTGARTAARIQRDRSALKHEIGEREIWKQIVRGREQSESGELCSTQSSSSDSAVEYDGCADHQVREPLRYEPLRYLQPFLSEHFSGQNLGLIRRSSRVNDLSGSGMHLMSIYLRKVVLRDHPEFLAEERLQNEIRLMHARYRSVIEDETSSYLIGRLLALLKGFHEIRDGLEDRTGTLKFHDMYSDMVRSIWALVDAEREISELESRIWGKWKMLLSERERQCFRCTTVKLQNEALAHKGTGSASLGTLVSELSELAPWLSQTISGSEHVRDWDDLSLAIKSLSSIDERKTHLALSNAACTESETIPNNAERKRLVRISSERYFACLIVNGKIVDRTGELNLDRNFGLAFDKTFRCSAAIRFPDVSLQIFKERAGGLLRGELICTVFIQLPSSDAPLFTASALSVSEPAVFWYQFAADKSKRLKDGRDCRVSGSALIAARWEKMQGDPNNSRSRAVPAPCSRLQGTRLNHARQHSKREVTLDSAVPDVRRILKSDGNFCNSSNASALREQLVSFKFRGTKSSFSEYRILEEPKRHCLIKMRNMKDIDDISSPIPLEETAIQNETSYRNLLRRARCADNDSFEDTDADQRAVVARQRIRDFVRRIRNSNRAKAIWTVKRQLHWSEVVQDVNVLRFAKPLDLQAVLGCFFPLRRRSLYPRMIETSPVPAHVDCCRLLVTVAGAQNVPSRETPTPLRRGDMRTVKNIPGAESSHTSGSGTVNSFVQVKFQGRVSRTSAVPGCSPLWKQSTLDIPLNLEQNNFSPQSLMRLREPVEIALFDAMDVDIAKGGGYYDDENTIVTDKRYLGHFSVPFSTVYATGKTESIFRIDTPDLNFGYALARQDPPPGKLNSGKMDMDSLISEHEDSSLQTVNRAPVGRSGLCNKDLIRHSEKGTYVQVLITLDPLLCAPERGDSVGFVCKEDEAFRKYLAHWIDKCRRMVPTSRKRLYPVLVPDVNGLTWMVTRFMRSQPPPPGFDSVQKCAHFVSLIPFLRDWEAFKGEAADTWCTNQQFIDLLAGGWGEHAALLANYFIYLSDEYPDECAAKVYLVFGTGIPEGKVIYVMRKAKDAGDISFWNAATGAAYAREDDKCPLQDIEMLVGRNNVFANLQPAGRPCLLNFDLRNKSLWNPFYTSSFPLHSTLPSIQEAKLKYSQPNPQFAAQLQDDIVDVLKVSIRGWRRGPTCFKSDVGNRLRGILDSLEKARLGGTAVDQRNSLMWLEGVTRGKNLFGSPLHLAFTDTDNLVKRVKATSIHRSKHPEVEFALAVRVFPYCSNVLSVWVFLIAMSPDV